MDVNPRTCGTPYGAFRLSECKNGFADGCICPGRTKLSHEPLCGSGNFAPKKLFEGGEFSGFLPGIGKRWETISGFAGHCSDKGLGTFI